jgi:hypothetical protein
MSELQEFSYRVNVPGERDVFQRVTTLPNIGEDPVAKADLGRRTAEASEANMGSFVPGLIDRAAVVARDTAGNAAGIVMGDIESKQQGIRIVSCADSHGGRESYRVEDLEECPEAVDSVQAHLEAIGDNPDVRRLIGHGVLREVECGSFLGKEHSGS